MTTRKVFTIAHLTPGLEQAWLQHLRDFDAAHPGCHFEVMADTPEMTLREMVERLRVNPDLTFEQIIMRERKQ